MEEEAPRRPRGSGTRALLAAAPHRRSGATRARPASAPQSPGSGTEPSERRDWLAGLGGWRAAATTLVSLAGLGMAVYLTAAHYDTGISLVCPNSGVINCEAVTTSPESYVFGIPVAVLGLAYFVGMLALALPWAWRSSRREVAYARLAGGVAGIGFVFYLVYAELFEIQKICILCTTVHVLTFVMFVLIVTGWDAATAAWRPELAGED